MDLLQALDEYEKAAVSAIQSADSPQALEDARIKFLGQSKGRLKELQEAFKAGVKTFAADVKKEVGKRLNEVKAQVESVLDQRKAEFDKPKAARSGIDVTLPAVPYELGRLHPVIQTIEEFKDLMGRFGFTVVDGPEIEDEYHNFIALNIPEDHPARDPLDNFYLATAQASAGGPCLLRSQTSTVQIRVMEHTPPPVRIVSLGRVYRPDTIDATHSCMFHQMEGLMIGESVTMADLKSVLSMFAKAYLGHHVGIRFRPSFFPFTEPSVEVDMQWEGDRWLEIGGAGMVDPNVLKAVGYDPEQVSGFAFGLGIERFCMQRHNVKDIRRFYENDLRFLRQF